VLEKRLRRDGEQEVVVDGSIADLPTAQFQSHLVIAAGRGPTQVLEFGGDRILGRLCLESDIIRSDVQLPTWLAEGDFLIFTQTGGYDVSMRYTFGRGRPA
jgi:diaminopimelate decarboxylase